MSKVLVIAGYDTSAGAGIPADMGVLKDYGAEGISIITAIAVQSDSRVMKIFSTFSEVIGEQMSSLALSSVGAVKIGMVATLANIRCLARFFCENGLKNVVIDPVLKSSSGYSLLEEDAIEAMAGELLPNATIVTPNISEAKTITGIEIFDLGSMKLAAKKLYDIVPSKKDFHVLVKGGHLIDASLKEGVVDLLYDGKEFLEFHSKRVRGKDPRGTGCRLSTAIAVGLARGLSVPLAVDGAHEYVERYIKYV